MTSAALAYDMPALMTVASDLLGQLSVESNAILRFPKGLLGFPECREFVLLPSERENLYWLQSVDYAALAFLMVDPFIFFEGFSVDLTTTQLGRAVLDPEHLTVLSIVTLPRDRADRPTANLQGPVVIDFRSGEGHQAILSDGKYGIREEFDL